jgi:hypothetical protein
VSALQRGDSLREGNKVSFEVGQDRKTGKSNCRDLISEFICSYFTDLGNDPQPKSDRQIGMDAAVYEILRRKAAAHRRNGTQADRR